MADTVINPALQQEQEAAAVLSESMLPGMPVGTGAAKPTSPRRLEHGGMQQGAAQMHDSQQGMNVGGVPPLPPAPMYTLPPLPVPHPGLGAADHRGLSEMGNGSVPDGATAPPQQSAAMLSHGSHDGESLHHDYIQQHIVAGHPTTTASSSNVAKPGLYPPPPVPYYQSQYYAAFQQPPHPHYPQQQMHMGGESRVLDYADVAPLSRVLKRPQPVKFASSSSSNGNDDYVDNIPVMLGKHPRDDDEEDLDTPDEVYQMDGPMAGPSGYDSMQQDDSYDPMDENSGRDSPAAAGTSKGKGAKGKSAKKEKGVQRPKLKGTACTACRKSKLKCDEGQPCAPCTRRRVDCVRDPGLRLQAWYGELQAAGQAGKFIDGIYAGHFGPSSALHSLGLFAAQQQREQQQQQQAAQQAGQDGNAHSPVYLHQQNQSSDLPQQHQHQMSSSRTEGVGDSAKPALQANHPSESVQESRAQARAAFQQKVAERAARNGTASTSTSTPTHGRNTRASAVKAEGENGGVSELPADAGDSASARPSPHRSASDSLNGILNEQNDDGVSFPDYLEPYREILLEAGIDSLATLRSDLQLEMLKDYVLFLFETYPEKLYNQTQKFKLQYALQKALS